MIMPIHKTYNLENNRKVDVFDDVFPLSWRHDTFSFCQNSAFKLGWSDTDVPERQAHGKFLFSRFSDQDLAKLKIFDYANETDIPRLVAGLRIKKTILNLSVPSDVNYVHTHGEKKVILYYANVEWGEGWHGETLFYSENLKEIQLGLPYTPGRIIVFDGDIPHTIRPQSNIAVQHRFTLALFYDILAA